LPLLWPLSVQLAGRISATEEAPWTSGNPGSTLAALSPISSAGAPMARSSPRSFRPKTPRITPTPPRRGSAASGVTATSRSQTSRWARPLPRTPCRSAKGSSADRRGVRRSSDCPQAGPSASVRVGDQAARTALRGRGGNPRPARRDGSGRTGKRRGGEMLTPGGWGTPD